MKNLKRNLGSVALLALAGFSTACGRTSYQENPGNDSQYQTPAPSDGSTPTTTPPPVTTPTATIIKACPATATVPSQASQGVPPYTYSFSITGSGSASFPADTDNVLKVRIKPDTAGLVAGTGFTAVYSCIKYSVAIFGTSFKVSTPVLRVGSGGTACPNAPTEQVIDFSGCMGTGHGPVEVVVSGVQTDFKYNNCLASPWLYSAWPYGSYSCDLYKPLSTLYTTHTATGMIDIQVNGTDL